MNYRSACPVVSGGLALFALAACASATSARYESPATPPLGTQLTLSVADTALAGNAPALALRIAQSIVSKDPGNADAWQREGDAYIALGQAAQAETSYGRALALRPGLIAAQLGLGRVELTRNPAAAEARFTQVLVADPHSLAALNDLGIARDLGGRHAEAQAAYRQVLALVPGDTAAQVNLGLSLALSGDSPAAIALLQPLAARPDATPRMRHDYAVALAVAGRIPEAEQLLRVDLTPEQTARAIEGYRELPSRELPSHELPDAPSPP